MSAMFETLRGKSSSSYSTFADACLPGRQAVVALRLDAVLEHLRSAVSVSTQEDGNSLLQGRIPAC